MLACMTKADIIYLRSLSHTRAGTRVCVRETRQGRIYFYSVHTRVCNYIYP